MRRLVLLLLAIPVMAQPLFTGAPVERELAAGETHSYRYPVQAGLFLQVRAVQLAGDVSLVVTAPDGTSVGEWNQATTTEAERVDWIVPVTGEYRIAVKTVGKPMARYRLEASTRTPDEADRHRHAAYVAMGAGEAQLGQKKVAAMREAAASFDSAAREWLAAGETAMAAGALNLAGVAHFFLTDYPAARQKLEEGARLVRGMPEARVTLASLLNNLGQVRFRLGNLAEARQLTEETLALRLAVGDIAGEGTARNQLSTIYVRLGLWAEAEKNQRLAIALHERTGAKDSEMIARLGLAEIHSARREHQAALQVESEVLRMARENGKVEREFSALSALGRTYLAIGELDLAQRFLENAVGIARKLGANRSVAGELASLASIQMRRQDFKGAVAKLEESLAMARTMGNQLTVGNSLVGLCYGLVEAKEWERAATVAEEAVALNRKVSPSTGLPQSLICMGMMQLRQGKAAAARPLFEEALAKAGTKHVRVSALDSMAALAEAEGKLLAAVGYAEEAAMANEEMRAGITDQTLRAAAGSSGAGGVRRHTRLLMALGYGERAYWVSERARARSLAEMLMEAESGSTAVPANGKTAEMVGAIAGVQKQLFREGISAERRGVLLGELAKAEMEWEAYRAQFSKAAGTGAVLEQPVLAGDTALIEYSMGEKESYAWVVTAAGVKSFVLVGNSEIAARVKALRELLSKPVNALTAAKSMAAFEAEAGRVFAMVMGPLEGALQGKTRIVIVPDGRLHYLPFEVLPGVLAKYRVSYAPSAAALAALEKRGRERKAPERTLLAVADPVLTGPVGAERGFEFTQLPNARAEAAALRGMFGGARVMVGAEAGEGAVKGANLGLYRYVHFATHGYFDEAVPGRSGLVLGQGREEDGFLQAREIFGMKLNADVVTLSACQSGLGKLLDGEGVVGLSRAFLYAGAQGMVVSLWNVNDAATAELMKAFYAGMKAGLGGAEALRRAKVSLAQGGNRAWRHPYFWAPFVFVGDAGK